MRRCLFNLLAALSLLAGLAVAGVWVRSYWVSEFMRWEGASFSVAVASHRGCFFAAAGSRLVQRGWEFERLRKGEAGELDSLSESWLGRRGFIHQATQDLHLFGVPCWVVQLVPLPLPIAWIIKRRRRLQIEREGHCRQCGYDLQGLPGPRPRCPECGVENQSPVPSESK